METGLATGQLGKGHAQKLIQTGEPLHLVVAAIPLNTARIAGNGKNSMSWEKTKRPLYMGLSL